mgnify:CR=1 FL=1
MFLVDKYYQDSNTIACHQNILDKLLKSFDTHNEIYENIDTIVKKPKKEFYNIIDNMENGSWQYANFQHILVYGPHGCGKEYIVRKLLEKIYGKKAVELQEVEYTISGYSNTKTKVMIKQSKYHIMIEPNNNGFDKYLIQEIIQNYAKTEILAILRYKKLFKIVVIDKIDDLSYYAQASLRRTMEKYANTCKFIFISNQLSKIIEPLKSRCLLVRVPLPTNIQILKIILYVSMKENIDLSLPEMKTIIEDSNNNINHAIWLLEFKKFNISNDKKWTYIIDNIVNLVVDKSNYNTLKMYSLIKKVRELFYILFITNIEFTIIIRKIMIKLLEKDFDLEIKSNIVEITSIFELRISQGTRYIIHLEAYIIRIIYLLYKHSEKKNHNAQLTEMKVLEI